MQGYERWTARLKANTLRKGQESPEVTVLLCHGFEYHHDVKDAVSDSSRARVNFLINLVTLVIAN